MAFAPKLVKNRNSDSAPIWRRTHKTLFERLFFEKKQVWKSFFAIKQGKNGLFSPLYPKKHLSKGFFLRKSKFGKVFFVIYYPFYKQDKEGFESRLLEVIDAIMYDDLPAVEDITFATVQKTRKLLMILAERCPQTPKMNELYAMLETTREQGLKMLYALERAALVGLVSTQPRNVLAMVKPNKILMDNPNLMYALSPHSEIGTLRESFFYNQLSAVSEVLYPERGDFFVDRKYTFEVGGRKKSFEQIKDMPNSFLAVDNTEVGHHNRIPLWMFGLLY